MSSLRSARLGSTAIFCGLLLFFALLLSSNAGQKHLPAVFNGLRTAPRPTLRPSVDDDRECAGWNPHLRREHDPPKCRRAKQFRQIQDFRLDPKHRYEEEVWRGLDRAEKCVLGWIECPENPIIVADWWYMMDAMRKSWSAPGEGIWLEGVVDAVQDEGFSILPAQQKLRARHLLRALSELVHMYWAQDIYAFQCVTDPTCIRPEDYHPSTTPEFRRPQPAADEVGTTPLYKIFAQTYVNGRSVIPVLTCQWGARPTSPSDMVLDRTLGDPETPIWSFNPLGQQFIMTPWPYPGHAWIPITVEQASLGTPSIPWEERNNTVIILAKHADIFYDDWIGLKILPHWQEIGDMLAQHGFELLTMSDRVDEQHPTPASIRQIGRQSREDYERILSQGKVVLGIGRPEISPSPFVALGKGLSLVMPYTGSTPVPEGYDLYDQFIVQHGPINAVGEPYVYTYNGDDIDDLKQKLLKAISTPMESYTPPEYTGQFVRQQTRQFLWRDYELEYHIAKKANGGKAPGVSEVMLSRCFQDGRCSFDPLPND